MTETALAAYSNAQSNSTNERGIARMGFCLPQECTQDDISDFFVKYMDTAAFGLGFLSEINMGMNSMIMRPYSVPGMQTTRSNTRVDEWQARTRTGMYVVATFTFILVAVTITINVLALTYGKLAFVPKDDKLGQYGQAIEHSDETP